MKKLLNYIFQLKVAFQSFFFATREKLGESTSPNYAIAHGVELGLCRPQHDRSISFFSLCLPPNTTLSTGLCRNNNVVGRADATAQNYALLNSRDERKKKEKT